MKAPDLNLQPDCRHVFIWNPNPIYDEKSTLLSLIQQTLSGSPDFSKNNTPNFSQNIKMSFFGDLRQTPAATKPPGAGSSDRSVPLMNLSLVQGRLDNLHQFLSDSVNGNVLLGQSKMDMVSSEIASAISQIIANGSALLSCTPTVCSIVGVENRGGKQGGSVNPDPNPGKEVDPKVEIDEIDDYEIVEMDAEELLAEHVHFCEICGKGFKRDANLRMHMRAHGNRFKTAEALAGPGKGRELMGRRRRFSCPYAGCNRNKLHKKFRPLKSAICVKNHFKRSHCPKMYACNRCNKKSFSVVADLKSHLKHCGESKWKCSCGTRFSRKDKLFGHMALFEGHMPAVVEEGAEGKRKSEEVSVDGGLENNNAFLEGFLDEFESIESYCIQDELYVDNGTEGWFSF